MPWKECNASKRLLVWHKIDTVNDVRYWANSKPQPRL